MLHPFPKHLISFSAGNLRESLRGPQPSQLSFVSRQPARPAVPPFPGDARRGRSPFNFSSYPGDLRAPPFPPPRGCAKGPQPLRLTFRRRGRVPRRGAIFYPSAHKKRMKPNAPSVPETAYLLFSRESLRGPQPFQLSFVSRRPARPAAPLPGDARFFHPSAHKKRMKPLAPSVPETAYLLFSRNLRESLRGPQPSQLPSYPGDLRAGGGLFLCREIPFPGAKIDSFPFSRPEIRRILAKTGKLILSKFLTR